MTSKLHIVALTVILLISACDTSSAHPVSTPVPASVTVTITQTPTDTPKPIPTDTPTSTPTPTNTPTPIPTYTVLRGEVNVDHLACRYGPGWPYLYFFGLLKGNNLEVIGRVAYGNWIQVQAIGGNRPCWVKAEFMDVKGDIMSVEPVYPEKIRLPTTPYYSPTTVLSATRDGNTVNISWLDIPLRAGDEENERMNHYIIEVWRCEAGQFIFEPLATNDLKISFVDEPGCDIESHGRIFVQDKHGFAGPSEIPWPLYEGQL